MRRLPSLLGAALVLALAAPAAAATPQLATTPMSAEDAAAIDAGIAAIMAKHPEVPAIYIGVWDPQRGIYQQAYGLADVAGRRAASLDDHFRIGSISKTFMAAVILQLVDEGTLRLTDTVADVDPDLATKHPTLAAITIEQLLGMTSGIPDYMNVPNAAVASLVTRPDTVWSADQLIGFGADGEVKAPGTGGYSTTNSIVLQVIAEKLTGKSIQDLIADRLTQPLGLSGTALPPNEDTTLPEPLAHWYFSPACVDELVADGATPVPAGTDTTDWNASYGQGGGGMHSTVGDLGAWAASMSGSSTLSDALAQTRLQFHDVALGPMQYGLGLIRFGNQVGHEGEAIGWEGWVGQDPATGLNAVVFTNTCADSAIIFQALGVIDPGFKPTADAVFPQ